MSRTHDTARATTGQSLTSACAFVCSTRLVEHTGDKGKATRPVVRPRVWTKLGALDVKADVQVNAIFLWGNTNVAEMPTDRVSKLASVTVVALWILRTDKARYL